MSEIMEDVAYLSQEIGPRPAGTEEEQQAALYIADQMQKRSGFAASIEDFSCSSQPGVVEAILFGLSALFSLLAIVFRPLVVPAFFISLICAILYVFELIDRPFLSRLFERGVSQNVVARYVPGKKADERGRKVVLVANYDSTKVASELNGGLFSIYPLFTKASTIGLIALPVIWLIRSLFLLHSTGMAVLFFNLLAAIALFLALVPVARFFLHRFATYNEAANNNAAGVATVLEVARLISEGSYSEEELAAQEAATIHDAETAHAAGVVPEGAELEYATEAEQTEEERLAAAKAAVAALTGKPLRSYENEDVVSLITVTAEDGTEQQVPDYGEYGYNEQDKASAAAPEPVHAEASSQFTTTPVSERVVVPEVAQPTAEDAPSARYEAPAAFAFAPASSYAPVAGEPEWFTAGRAKAAKTPEAKNTPARRGRYADALEVAVAASRKHFDRAAAMLEDGSLESISQRQRDFAAADDQFQAGRPQRDLFTLRSEGPQGAGAEEELAEESTVRAYAEEEQVIDEVPVAEVVVNDEVIEEFEVAKRAEVVQDVQQPEAEEPAQVDQQPEAEEPAGQPVEQAEDAPESEAAVEVEESIETSDAASQPAAREEVKEETAPAPTYPARSQRPAPTPRQAPTRRPAPGRPQRPTPTIPEIDVEPAAAPSREKVAETLPTIEPLVAPEPRPLESVMLSYEEVEMLDGATTAMAPIDVEALRAEINASSSGEAKQAKQAKEAPRQTEQLGAASERSRARIDLPPVRFEQEQSVEEEPKRLVEEAAEEAFDGPAQLSFEDMDYSEPESEDDNDEPEADEFFDEADAEAERLAAEEAARRAVAEKRAALRSAIPTLSGDYTPTDADKTAELVENSEVSKTGSFAAVGSATSINPVGDELVADLAPEDRYVDDADDSTFEENVTESGAFAGPGYMDMPESRISRFFNRFRRKEDDVEETSTDEWLDVDDSFSAPSAGAARGGWESFRTEPDDEYDDMDLYEDDEDVEDARIDLPVIDQDDIRPERPWHGGAFSRLRALVQGDGDEEVDLYEDLYGEDYEGIPYDASGETYASEPFAEGSEDATEVLSAIEDAPVEEDAFDLENGEYEEIEVFDESGELAETGEFDDTGDYVEIEELELIEEADVEADAEADVFDDAGEEEPEEADAPAKESLASKALGFFKSKEGRGAKSSSEKTARSASSEKGSKDAAKPSAGTEEGVEEKGSSFDAEAEAARIAEEASLVYSFRNPDVNTEVWFVALGSEYAGNGGIKAFLDEHADELRGAIIVNLEATGAGTLSYIEEEGYVTTRRPSSRLKRFLRKATEVTGITAGTERIDWRESAASVAMHRGLQAMTLAGMEGGKPALLGQGDDVLENIDEAQIAENARFVLELIKNI